MLQIFPNPIHENFHIDEHNQMWVPYLGFYRKHNNQHQTVYVIGMVHSAPEVFYQNVIQRINNWVKNENTFVFHEGATLSDPLTVEEEAFIKFVNSSNESFGKEIKNEETINAVLQNNYLIPTHNWYNADLSLIEILKEADLNLEAINQLQEDLETFGLSLEDIKETTREDEFIRKFTDSREQNLFKLLDETLNHENFLGSNNKDNTQMNLVIPWGTIHSASIAKHLLKTNFEAKQTYWVNTSTGQGYKYK